MREKLLQAHRTFRRWEPYVGLLMATGAFGAIGKHLNVFGAMGWPEAIFLGVIAAFLVALSLAGWRYFRPLPPVPSASRPENSGSLAKLEQSVSLICDRIASNEEAAASDRAILSNLGGSIEQLKQELLREIAREEDYRQRGYDGLADALRGVQLGMRAIYHRERLQAREAEIREQGDLLIRPSQDKIEVKGAMWQDWLKAEEKWRESIDRWCELAELYSRHARQSVFDTPEQKYRMNWDISDEQLPNSDAVFSYKTFRIIYANWLSVRDVVEQRVLRAAYDGQANQIIKDAE